MRILHWNCQGLGSTLTIPHLKDIRNTHNPDIILLVETKHVDSYVNNLAKDLEYDHCFVIPAKGSSGGVAIMWKDGVKIHFLGNPSMNKTDMYVEDGSKLFCLSYIYGNPDVATGFYQHRPRLMLGDFNEIKSNDEKEGGIIRSEASFFLFRSMISISGMHDLKTIGGYFTWIGNRAHYHIKSRIDRTMANCDWLDMYPTAHVKLLPWIGSDHRPLLVCTEDIKVNKHSLFRYDNRWRFNPEVKRVIKDVWATECTNIPPKDFHRIIEKCRRALSRWKSKNQTNTTKRINQLKEQIQQMYQSSTIDYATLNILKVELNLQYRMEEEYWRTKSRIQWLNAGDRNSKFFHSKTKQRRSRNRIIHIKDDQGNTKTKPGDIREQIMKYFQKLYTSEGTVIDEDLLRGIPVTISEEINTKLTAQVTEKEIEAAAFSINPDKSPGPDGMNAGFYRHHWEIIKQGVIPYVKTFFHQNHLDPKLNQTHVCLIPKIDSPSSIRDYRPISLSNVAYKIISKILAERLKPYLNGAISENQNAFISGRLITDNVLIAHELMHSLHTKKLKTKFMAFKLDISKAFDKVEWNFIVQIMRRMGFCNTWCQWIHKCLSTVSYSILINGEPTDIIRPQRGIRQGDPISPYLYILCAEGLSQLI